MIGAFRVNALINSLSGLHNTHGMVYCIIQGVVGYNSKINCIYFSEDCLDLASSVDHDEMSHYAAFHLSLHCLPYYAFTCRSHWCKGITPNYDYICKNTNVFRTLS